jgi:hypothetical protein
VSGAPATATNTRTVAPTATATIQAQPTHRPTARVGAVAPAGPPRFVSAVVEPRTSAPGGQISATVVTTGAVSRVDLYVGSGLPNSSGPLSYRLVQSAGGHWSGGGRAPTTSGQYHYTIGLYDRSGTRTVIDNDAWNMTVAGGAAQSGGPQPLPADIPLAPPFSYGNPVAAVFSANGKAVSGSEVTSVTRTDIAPSVVAQFYDTRLPRAGWTLQTSAPTAGAASFSIQAVKGTAPAVRVCIVQYANSTIHIFYGTIPG